jgi:hypothetical protein
LRPLTGNSFNCCSVMTAPMLAPSDCKSGASAVTVTSSEVSPTCRLMSKRA